ncbi:hypothetical protein OS493_011445 [Desmophyllum pertusum]|uniref:F5/8 type C domain-containing protein n=1 Tax=Desmophyllum pertusum TaxID=174260 RepID=A0A9W9YQD3_9CNID|nr:hypothetical protein OS493_011445 [Desmophyllum pertusum]
MVNFSYYRVFLPSGKAFHNCSGVICALKKESAKPIASRSSDGPGDASDIFNHNVGKTSGTEEMKGSWWCIDLGENYLLGITHYALKHGRIDGESILPWQLEGSNDGISWKKLETSHNSDNPNDPPQFGDPHPFFTGTCSVEDKAGAFRFFRILQTGRHYSGKYGVYLSGVELYGILLDV